MLTTNVIADPAGRVFCGTMSTKERLGRLYRLDVRGRLVKFLDGIGTSNGMGFTPNRKQMYHTDSLKREIYIFDYDESTGAITNREVFVRTPEGEETPDGMTVDAEGNDRDNLCNEYIVIKNRRDTSVDLTGWTIYDEAHHRYLFPSFVLKAKTAVTLRTCLGKNTQSEIFWGSRSPIWNNDGDTIFMRDSEGQLALSLIY